MYATDLGGYQNKMSDGLRFLTNLTAHKISLKLMVSSLSAERVRLRIRSNARLTPRGESAKRSDVTEIVRIKSALYQELRSMKP